MKIIDLLVKISKGEEVPKKFTYNGYLWEYDIKNKMWFYYFGEGKNHRFDRLFYLNMILNNEVEIIEEEKEIEHINIQYWKDDEYTPEERINVCMTTINQLIDVINDMRDKE